jgi:FemAB-related protein (PEP-CTERM system-associated)
MIGADGIIVRSMGSDEERRRWDSWVGNEPTATFFHLSKWQSVFEDVFRHRTTYLFAERTGELVGVLPLVEMKSRLFGHSLSSLPFCAYGGAIGESEAITALEARAEELARELGVEYLEYRNFSARHEEWPRNALYVTFRKPLSSKHEDNLSAIPRKQRAMVRKASKRGLRSVVDDNVDRFYNLYADNVHRHGTPPLPKRYFAELSQRFGANCQILTVEDERCQPVSSVLSFFFRDEVLPYYAGDLPAARGLAANDFKYWELMRRAVDSGQRLFDFGRSKVGTGPFSFKKNWGFEPLPLSYEYRLFKCDTVPQQNPLNPKYRLLIALWRRMPLTMANALGPHIVRNLG